MNKRVLVTGATGFIGNYVVKELLEHNFHVITTSRDKSKAKKTEWFSSVEYVPYDLKVENENFYQLFRKPDMMIHLAWENLPNYKDLSHYEHILFYHYRFVKNILVHGLKNLVATGTCLEYGMAGGALHENMVTNPDNPYAVAKDSLRKFLKQLNKYIDFDFKWIRLFYMYGEGQREHSIYSQLDKAIANSETSFNMSFGEQLRDYLPVKKVAEYIMKIALQNRIKGCINCCSGKPISIRKLVEDYLEEKQVRMNLNLGHFTYPDFEPMAFWGDDTKLKMALEEKL